MYIDFEKMYIDLKVEKISYLKNKFYVDLRLDDHETDRERRVTSVTTGTTYEIEFSPSRDKIKVTIEKIEAIDEKHNPIYWKIGFKIEDGVGENTRTTRVHANVGDVLVFSRRERKFVYRY